MDYQSQVVQSIAGDEVETHALSINIDAIMVAIQCNHRPRQAAGLYQAIHLPEFEEATCPEEPAGNDHNPLLYFLLGELNQIHAPRFHVELNLAPSRLDKLPVIGLLWDKLRRHLHSLSIFYTNKVAGQIIGYNRYLVTILNLMIRQDQKRDAEITQLKQRLVHLEAQLTRLEKR